MDFIKTKADIKIGDKVNIYYFGSVLAAIGPNNEITPGICTVIKVGTKRIECTDWDGKKGWFAYYDQNQTRTFKKIA